MKLSELIITLEEKKPGCLNSDPEVVFRGTYGEVIDVVDTSTSIDLITIWTGLGGR